MKTLFTILCVCIISYTFSQNYANSWIDYSQTYYRIPVTQNGVYKITHSTLINNGISIGDFDPRNIQMFHKGKSIPIFVSGQEDGIFNSSDYILFYAEKNTGWLDSAIYINSKQLNPNYSQYNDTASYFLCFANTISSLRYDTSNAHNFSQYSPISYCLKTSRADFTQEYNYAQNAAYVLDGEGWTDEFFTMGESVTKALSTPNFQAGVNIPYTLKYGVSGQSETQHDLIVETSDYLFDTVYYDYNAIHKTVEIYDELNSTTQIEFRSQWSSAKNADKNSVAYVEITYPHSFNFQGRQFMEFTLPAYNQADSVYVEIINFDGGEAPYVLSQSNSTMIRATKDGSKYKCIIPHTQSKQKCIIVNPNSFRSIQTIHHTSSQNTHESVFYDVQAGSSHEGDYIIITHKSLWNSAVSYKNYRQKTGFNPVLIDIDELYNQFGYGIQKHPYAVHNFIQYATHEWNIRPEHVFILGKGLHMPSYRKNENNYAKCLIPAMGTPSSDLLYTTDLHGNTMRANIAIGRLAAETPEEVDLYRKKVEQHESQTPAPWMKNVMHFGGGANAIEQRLFRIYLASYEKTLEQEFFGAHVETFLKKSSTVFEKTEPETIREMMNEGTSLCTFFGH
ncbi:MAG: C25 family cysteine peptidase, partial [Bacteroidales bacterium]